MHQTRSETTVSKLDGAILFGSRHSRMKAVPNRHAETEPFRAGNGESLDNTAAHREQTGSLRN